MVCEVVSKQLGSSVRVLDGGLDPDTLAAATLRFVAEKLGETEARDDAGTD